ncbi:MAG: hypothetical protein HXX13_04910 [Bacteroidetes bacterium]|nr:hypothetical protein [Bacteroidota bacterium]
MVNPVIAPMVIAAKIHKYFSRFENAGATSPETSKTLQSLGLHEGLLFNRLLRNGVFKESSQGKYYVNRHNYDKFRVQRKRKALLIMGGVVTVFLIISIFY